MTPGKIGDRAENLRRAIAACEEALKVRTEESMPIDYAQTLWNLAIAYSNLAEVENEEENMLLAEECMAKARPILEREGYLKASDTDDRPPPLPPQEE